MPANNLFDRVIYGSAPKEHKKGDVFHHDFEKIMSAPTNVCHFSVTNELDGERATKFYPSAPCHASMARAGYKNTVMSSTSLICSGRSTEITPEWRKSCEKLWTFMLNKKKSPWRGVLKDRIIHKKNGNMYAVTFMIDDKTHSQELVNLMTALRITNEHGQVLKVWEEFVNAGASEVDALYLAHSFSKRGNLFVEKMVGGHYPFNMIDYNKFTSASPDNHKDKKFRKGTSYRPCNTIWAELKNDVDEWGYKQKDYPQALKFLNELSQGAKPYAGIFRAIHRRKHPVQNDTYGRCAATIIKKLEESKKEWLTT